MFWALEWRRRRSIVVMVGRVDRVNRVNRRGGGVCKSDE